MAESDHSSCCSPAANENEESSRKCIPDGVNGCQRAALLKSTCCGSHVNSTPGAYQLYQTTPYARLLNVNGTGTPSEEYDPGFLTGSSDAILLKELKSIIQEHSTHR